MKKNFKNELDPKYEKVMKSPWDFSCPEYDERSSCYVNAGSHYGVGYRQPVGTLTHNNKNGVPVGKGMGMTVDEIPVKNLTLKVND